MNREPTKILDVKNLACPLPILKAKQALRDLKPNDTLLVLTTDPQSLHDFRAFSQQTNNELIEITQCEDFFTIWIRKKS